MSRLKPLYNLYINHFAPNDEITKEYIRYFVFVEGVNVDDGCRM